MSAASSSASRASFADRVLEVLTTPHRRIGASVMRAILGSAIVLFYLQNIGWRRFFWGPDGLVPRAYAQEIFEKHGPNLFLASASPAYFEFVFWGGLVAALLFASGRFVPFSTLACAIMTWCLIARDVFVTDSGWTLATLLLMYAVVLDCGTFLAAGKGFAPRAGALLHNFGVALILWQISLLYASACFFKITGHKWQDGTALYYILRSNQFDLTPLGSHVYHSAVLVAVGTYATLVLQAAFPFCIWQRPAKYIVALGAIGFHVGIAYTMALPLFSLVMLSCEAMLFSDDDYRAALTGLRRLGARLGAAIAQPEACERPILIFDADCGMCTRFAGSKLVRAARVRPVGYQVVADDAGVGKLLRERGLDPGVFASAMVVISGPRVAVGAAAFNLILRRRGGWAGIAGRVLSLGGIAFLEGLVYRMIAAQRRRISAWLGESACAPRPARRGA
jgi:predicted DCC family thiol-disulfide oxidoreductase YuxK